MSALDLKKVMDSLTEIQKMALLLLSSKNKEPIKGKLWYQKEMFLLAQNNEDLKCESNFEPDFMGPYSENADEELEQLQLSDLIEYERSHIKLTASGLKISEELKKKADPKLIEMIEEFKDLFNDLNQDELLAFIYFSYPNTVSESVKIELLRPKRTDLAVSLYLKRKASVGKASEIAGLTIEKFMTILKERRIAIYSE